MNTSASSRRTVIRRLPELANHDRAMLHQIIDEAYVCHIAFGMQGETHCIPTAHWRIDEHLYIHGSNGSRLLKALQGPQDVAVSIALIDGLVLAKSAFSHTMNYRSVVIYGRFEPVTGREAKLAALDAFMDKIAAGRKDEARHGDANELDATTLLRLSLAEVAVKVSDTQPQDKDEDKDLPVWAGVLPMRMAHLPPVPAPGNEDISAPRYVTEWTAG